MGEIKAISDTSQLRFGSLAMAKTVLVLPHSNADPERLLSMVHKIETEHRTRLSPDTVADLLSYKINIVNALRMSILTPELLQAAKSATMRSLRLVTECKESD